jgi:hypothetical protein
MEDRMLNETKPAPTTLVTFLLDRTGSMESIKDDTIGAFNAYLSTLKKDPAGIEFSFLQFDSIAIDKVCVNRPVAEVAPLTDETFQPRASTPLIDAAYATIEAVGEAIGKRGIDPQVVICIQTDGQENASTAHTWDELNLLIKEKSKLGWQFNFMGAGIDAYQQARRMGIADAATVSYDKTSARASMRAFQASAENTIRFAKMEAMDMSFSARQKEEAGDAYVDLPDAPDTDASDVPPLVEKLTL